MEMRTRWYLQIIGWLLLIYLFVFDNSRLVREKIDVLSKDIFQAGWQTRFYCTIHSTLNTASPLEGQLGCLESGHYQSSQGRRSLYDERHMIPKALPLLMHHFKCQALKQTHPAGWNEKLFSKHINTACMWNINATITNVLLLNRTATQFRPLSHFTVWLTSHKYL